MESDEEMMKVKTAWAEDEFVLDPNRLTLHIGKVGFPQKLLSYSL